MRHFRPLFLAFPPAQLINKINVNKIADDWIRTQVLWCQKSANCALTTIKSLGKFL